VYARARAWNLEPTIWTYAQHTRHDMPSLAGREPIIPMSSGYHVQAQAQHVWVQVECLDLFFTSNRLRHLAQAHHSLRFFLGPHTGLLVFY
jgi:hypothetical protein